MRVSRGKASVSGDITVSEDLDFLTTYQVKGLASPASGEALRKGNKDIANAEIADAAAIAATKISGTAIVRTLLTAQGDIIVRGASVPARFAKPTTDQFLKATATGYEGSAIPSPLTVAETEVFNGTAPTSWTDLNLSATIGAQATLVWLKFTTGTGNQDYGVRRDGDSDELYDDDLSDAKGVASGNTDNGTFIVLCVPTSVSGIIEWKTNAASTVVIDVIAYIK